MIIRIINKIPDVISAKRLEAGIYYEKEYSTSAIAKKLGVTRQAIENLIKRENDNFNPTIITLIKLSYVLNCQYDDLFDIVIVEDGKNE